MLEEIRIRGLGVIEESVLELGPGFTAITGETGAGKTMVVTALGLLLGARADAGSVRTGARAARVEGLVRVAHGAAWADGLTAEVDKVGGEIDDGALVVARQISAEGRSRAFVGGASCPVGALAALIDPLVAVHGQSDQHRLLQPAAQRENLDRFAGPDAAAARAEYAVGFRRLRETERELTEVVESARERAREADLLRFGLVEVEAVAPRAGEEDELAAEESRLGYADTLRAAAEQAREALSAEESGPDALGAVSAARRLLDGVREHDPEVAGLADRLAEVSYLLADVAADVASYAAGIDTDPARLAAVSERRAALTALTRKYGDTLEEVLAWAEAGAARLNDLDGTDERIEELRGRREELRSSLAGTAARLSAIRTEAAGRLGAVVTEELTALAMPHAAVTVRVTQLDGEDGLPVEGRTLRFGPSGVDEVELLLAANPGAEPRPLGKGASGGELSRVMLAVEVALAASNPVPTFVFDEVDAGVGGKAAVEVGRRLSILARHAQVLVVTHLPQVAAFADQHVVVRKSSDGTVTTSGLSTLDDASRVRELSRMLAGLEDSDTALAHAEELLATAQESRPV
ncbi:DNA repair protein RecN [Nocardioides mesophilus]|uniref:DNA repair protein RecN n=1 Tax=Nocardioides mesophilus TaxID=433659 RepID=A0A7G9RAJ3_9ACTN|nr:DNA repair protein RecN [Nocardioides mesophilus]QNN52618.1 DNA repair protein RecN [Nocardioides mesophilus]